jgi:CNT family concentrative nucleoside transporter
MLIALFDSDRAEGFSVLNLISLIGLFVMVLLAWLMSSNRARVNWRMVAIGTAIQLLLAALLFNSQNWTFDRSYDSYNALLGALNTGSITEVEINNAIAESEAGTIVIDSNQFQDIQELKTWIEKGDGGPDAISANFDAPLSVPRFRGGILFWVFDSFFGYVKKWADEGAKFVLQTDPDRVGDSSHPLLILTTFAFGVLPTVIFFATLMSVLYHIRVMQVVVQSMAWVMQRLLGTSGSESLAAAANVLVGHTEAPLVVRPYIGNMTRSELNAMMVGGFATISGGLMAVYVSKGISAGHLVTASLISAPAGLVIAKILLPETETSETLGTVRTVFEKRSANVIEAAATGASEGMSLAINIAAMLIAFLAMIAMVDTLLVGVGELVERIINVWRSPGNEINIQWSLVRWFGVLFWPMAWIMGIEQPDCSVSGQLLGTKMVVNEFLAYLNLGDILDGRVSDSATGDPIQISRRTEIILTYALCGFSNFGAIGIQLGGIGPLAPHRKSDLAQLGLRAMLGGTLACCMTACIAGLLFGII